MSGGATIKDTLVNEMRRWWVRRTIALAAARSQLSFSLRPAISLLYRSTMALERWSPSRARLQRSMSYTETNIREYFRAQ